MKKHVCLLIVWLATGFAYAGPISRDHVPDPLKPWIGWVLHGHTDVACPAIYNDLGRTICGWPSELSLEFGSSRAVFRQKWEVYSEEIWIELPGNARFWPMNVEIDGVKQAVGGRNGVPAVLIKTPGAFTIRGEFQYNTLPEWIDIPAATGILTLAIDGKEILFPNVDAGGKLWLRQGLDQTGTTAREDRHQLKVYRLVRDEIPLQVVTRIDLHVSGRHREIRLGKVFPDTFIPMYLNSAIPAKIESDGTLLLQVKPGQWAIEVTARHKGPVRELAYDAMRGLEVNEEIWVFESRNHLRMVTVEGLPQIDPQQTTIPDDWKKNAVYLAHPGDRMTFVEQKRGDPKPAPDQLKLSRTLWLDFNGKGLSIRDRIFGKMTSGWRLSMNAPVELGRVAVNGNEQLITRLDGSDNAGVEMRYGQVNLEAESRINDLEDIPATGWDRDFHSVEAVLNLPPGWTLLDASGIDNITQTWLKQWSLMDLFLVLIISLAVARIRSWPWGVVAIGTLILISQEGDAPRWIWLHILAAIALLRVVPQGKIRTMINHYRMACIVALIVISLPFMVNQIRRGLYPQTERSWQQIGIQEKGLAPHEQMPDEAVMQKAEAPAAMRSKKMYMSRLGGGMSYEDEAQPQQVEQQLRIQQIDPNAKIQTGPGIPNWQWSEISFSWNGPVEKEQRVSFTFISPFQNLMLSVIRVLLLAALIYGVIGIAYSKGGGFDFSAIRRETAAAVILLFFCLHALPAHGSNTFPTRELLDELKTKLTEKEPPPCAPDCASSPRMSIRIAEDILSARMEIHALHGGIAVPLPGMAQQWLPQTVAMDNAPVSSLYRDPVSGNLWMRVPEGIHTIDLKGALPPGNGIQLPLPLKPHHVDIQADGWIAEGLYDNGLVDKQLQFTRTQTGEEAKGAFTERFQPGLLPPFIEITRIFHLDLDWRIETVVKRVTPPGSAIVLPIPLLEGESVTSDIRVEDGKVLLNMAPEQNEFRWASSMEKKNSLVLTAADTLTWSETWKVDIGTAWHAKIVGIPVIHHQNTEGNWLPEWRPWPGEIVTIEITRPEGVQGQTHTIENTHLAISPGKRIRNVELRMDIRSSRGGAHVIRLPEDARLQSVEIDGKSQPIRQEKDTVSLPLTPGIQEIKLAWRELHPMKTVLNTSLIHLGMNSVDSFITVTMPRDRWILFCGGPYIGPAVLFWGVVFVLLLAAGALGRLRATPLKARHWALLCLGLTQASLLIALPVVAWFLVLGYRKKMIEKISDSGFNFLQVAIIVLSIFACGCLLRGIENGLLGYPNMQIGGNGSGDYVLNWYQDISGENLPGAWVLSLPLTVYRVTILLWALWLSFAFIKWLRWAWECFSAEGLWRKIERKKFFRRKEPAGETGENTPTTDMEDMT